MANYFENPQLATTALAPDPFAQYQGKVNGGFIEWGTYSFATTELTVNVPTYFSKITAAVITATGWSSAEAVVTIDPSEQFYCDLEVLNTSNSQHVVVTRIIPDTVVEYHFPIDNGKIGNDSANDIDSHPLFIAPKAMTLTEVQMTQLTAFTSGTVIFNLGSDSDDGKYLEDITVTKTAKAVSGTTVFTSGTADVADGDVLYFETEGGTGGGPSNCAVSISAKETVAATSALTFSYIFFGLW